MFRYQNNAFRVLGLLPDATLSQVRQRADEIKVKNDLGLEISLEYDFPLLGELDRSYENVISAVERLEHPLLRLKEEIFYFWIDNETDKNGIELLREGRIKKLIRLWTIKKLDRKNISTSVNRVVLSHSIAIYSETKGNFSDENWTHWEIAMKSFVEFSQSDLYWNKIKGKIKRFKDKRAEKIDLTSIQENYLDEIIKVNFMFISQYLTAKNYEIIRKHISLLKDLEVSSKHIDNVLKHTTDIILYHTKRAEDWLNQNRENTSLQELVDIGKKYKSGIQNFIEEGKCVDIEGISSFSVALDKSAQLLREFAVIIHNKSGESYIVRSTAFEGYREAYTLMVYAYNIICSPYLKAKFKKDLEILRKNYDFSKSVEKLSQKDREYVKYGGRYTQERKGPSLWSIIKWGFWIFVSIAILSSIFRNSSEESKKNDFKIDQLRVGQKLPNLPGIQKKEQLPQPQTTTITERRENLEQQIKDKKNKIKGRESSLLILQIEADNLKKEIDSLNLEYSNSYNVPQYVIDDYNEKVEKYNAIVKKYESIYAGYKKELEEHNEMVRQYNNMLK